MTRENSTLFDAVYRASFSKKTNDGWRSNEAMRRALESTHRFILDDAMSSFMADLANESFLRRFGDPVVMRMADSIRTQARLPHPSVWIEYSLRDYQRRSCSMRNTPLTDEDELPLREGWLIQQHPAIETACTMQLFNDSDIPDKSGFQMWTFPFTMAWCCDDSPLPWRSVFPQFNSKMSMALTGINGYVRDNVSCVDSQLITPLTPDLSKVYTELLREWTGTLRRVWALLATIDNLPVIKGEKRLAKGFLGGGRIRKYLNHTTLTLNIPGKADTRVLARKLIAHAHRKRHEVRGHFRDDWRNPPGRCTPHLWECDGDNSDVIICSQCHGRQFYIHKHERGDASVGYTTHSYQVKHNTEN
jgi:hypothetical protein